MELSRDLEIIALQERELQLRSFNSDIAWQLGVRLRELALSRNASVVIDVRRFGQPLFYAALAGTSPDNREWARKKSNVVARFHRSSYAVGLILRQKKTKPSLTNMDCPRRVTHPTEAHSRLQFLALASSAA